MRNLMNLDVCNIRTQLNNLGLHASIDLTHQDIGLAMLLSTCHVGMHSSCWYLLAMLLSTRSPISKRLQMRKEAAPGT